MGGGVAQGQKRVEFLQPFSGLLALHRLGLVNDQNWVSFSDNINGPAGTKFIQLHVNPAGILAFCIERLGIDNHHIDGAVRRKAVDLRQLGGVVYKKAYLLPIFLGKMLLGHLKGLIHALSDSYAGNDNNKFAPAVVLVQLEHGLDVGVGLAHTGLHLNGEVVAVGPSLQLVRRLDLVGALDFVQLLQNPLVGQLRHDPLVAESGEVPFFIDTDLIVAAASVHHIGGGQIGLSGKDIHNGPGRVGLEFLVSVLKSHEHSPPFFLNVSLYCLNRFCSIAFNHAVNFLIRFFACAGNQKQIIPKRKHSTNCRISKRRKETHIKSWNNFTFKNITVVNKCIGNENKFICSALWICIFWCFFSQMTPDFILN